MVLFVELMLRPARAIFSLNSVFDRLCTSSTLHDSCLAYRDIGKEREQDAESFAEQKNSL